MLLYVQSLMMLVSEYVCLMIQGLHCRGQSVGKTRKVPDFTEQVTNACYQILVKATLTQNVYIDFQPLQNSTKTISIFVSVNWNVHTTHSSNTHYTDFKYTLHIETAPVSITYTIYVSTHLSTNNELYSHIDEDRLVCDWRMLV